jgi:hypothetical protein
MINLKTIAIFFAGISLQSSVVAQHQPVSFLKGDHKIDVLINGEAFTTFLFPDSLEKPVLYPVHAPNGTVVTRGYPINPKPGEPTDHPHHLGAWFNFENVNGLDFWNNSFAIPKEKKHLYGWIKTQPEIQTNDSKKGVLVYQANWNDQNENTLLHEVTTFEFSGNKNERIIDRMTTLVADTLVVFKDAKDGMLAIRLAQELQIPTLQEKKFTDDKGIVTTVKASADNISNGNYVTSEGKQGDSAWSTRARWCKVYGKMGQDSVSVSIIDHPQNPNYPTFWHARGYGLFAANPLGEAIFTNGKSQKNLTLQKGEYVTFRFRMIFQSGKNSITKEELDNSANQFGK